MINKLLLYLFEFHSNLKKMITLLLLCSGLDLSYEKVDSSGTTLTIRGVKARGKQAKVRTLSPLSEDTSFPESVNLLSYFVRMAILGVFVLIFWSIYRLSVHPERESCFSF